jgi:FkbM family methyltransferase
LFLDVGAATGAALLPIAIKKPGTRIIAFEPTLRAGKLLRKTLEENKIDINLFCAAVSDNSGVSEFYELNYDPEMIPFLTETSGLASFVKPDGRGFSHKVPTVKLDDFMFSDKKIVAKIDVEGAEIEVLEGAREMLKLNKVWLSIDIHGDTEIGCRNILNDYGYVFERRGHVLLCCPAG